MTMWNHSIVHSNQTNDYVEP